MAKYRGIFKDGDVHLICFHALDGLTPMEIAAKLGLSYGFIRELLAGRCPEFNHVTGHYDLQNIKLDSEPGGDD